MAPTSKRTATDKVEILESKVSKKDAIEEAPEVTLFREYLRIKSVQPDPDYDSCLVFLRKQAERLGLEHHTTEMVKGKVICPNFSDFLNFAFFRKTDFHHDLARNRTRIANFTFEFAYGCCTCLSGILEI